MWATIEQMAPYAIGYTIPIMITAFGGLFSERSGITNIGLEGLMVIGSFIGGVTVYYLGPEIGYSSAAWVSVLFAILGGTLFSVLHAFASINLNADQTISGTAINLMAGAFVLFVSRKYVGTANIVINSMTRIDIPFLMDIPVIGPLFFTDTYPTTWLVLFIILLSNYIIYKTSFGLRLRACGDYPEAAEAAGFSVAKMRYAGVLLSGAFAGLGGAIYTITIAGQSNGSVDGLGFLALAGLIFGQWKPFRILIATLFFGFAVTIAQISMLLPSFESASPLALRVFPYVATLLALVVFSKKSQAPRAVGKPFDYKKTLKAKGRKIRE